MREREAWATLPEAIRAFASDGAVALRFLPDGETEGAVLTYAEFDRACRATAAWLQEHTRAGARVLVSSPSSLEFAIGIVGTWYADRVAVPAPSESSGSSLARLRAIQQAVKPDALLTTTGWLDRMRGVQSVSVCDLSTLDWGQASSWIEALPAPKSPALLQFSSGSSAQPKGIALEHCQLAANEQMIAAAFGHDASTVVVGWLPLHHDMGLIGNLLQPLYVGGTAILMPPAAFLRSPRRWLRAIDRYRATTSGGPDFAFDLCTRRVSLSDMAGCDLRSWRIAFNGSERVRPSTIKAFVEKFSPFGFRRRSFYPCYGLAEATLFVTGGRMGESPIEVEHPSRGVSQVSCGFPWLGTEVEIVDPSRRVAQSIDEEGEIWVRGPAVASGYLSGDDIDGAFGATTADGRGGFLRTGDLGRLTTGGLVITGRLKDAIIIRGRNLAAEDVEAVVETVAPDLAAGAVVAIASMTEDEERLVVIAELNRGRCVDPDAFANRLRIGIASELDVHVDELALVRPGAIPRTSSGKPRRSKCRSLANQKEIQAWFSVTFARPGLDGGAARVPWVEEQAERKEIVVEHLLTRLKQLARWQKEPDHGSPLAQLGLDSIAMVGIGAFVEDRFGVKIDATALYRGLTVCDLAEDIMTRWVSDAVPVRDAETEVARVVAAWRAIWVADRVADAGAYHLTLAATIESPMFSTARLAGALQDLVARHEGLRATYPAIDGQAYQALLNTGFHDVGVIETSDDAVASTIEEIAHASFDVATGPLFRARILRAPSGRRLVLVAHHLVLDFWSAALLLRELEQIIGKSDAQGELHVLPEPSRSTPVPPCAQVRISFDPPRTRDIRDLAHAHATTPFVVVLAAYHLAVRNVLGSEVQLEIAQLGRETAADLVAIEHRAGIAKLDVTSGPELDLAREIRTIQAALARAACAQQDPTAMGLRRCVLTWQSLPPGVPSEWLRFLLGLPDAIVELGPLRLRAHPVASRALPFAASLMLGDGGERIEGWLRADPTVGEAAARSLCSHVRTLLAAQHPDHRTIPDRFEGIVDEAPEALALSFGKQQLTYGELDAAANRVAAKLIAHGIGREELVGLLVERSAETIVGILGILKAGGAYIPIDPAYPSAYQQRLLTRARVILTREGYSSDVPAVVPLITFESAMVEVDARPRRTVTSDNAAYVIHTSGSTGEPKAVVVPHRNVCRLIDQLAPMLGCDARDVWSCFHSASFDFSVWEIWGALLTGGKLVVVSDDTRRDPERLRSELVSERVSAFSVTPTVFRELESVDAKAMEKWNSLRVIVFGGEALDAAAVARWFARHGDQSPQLVNMYGITETTVHVTVQMLKGVDVSGTSPPIGRAMAGMTAHVLGNDFRRAAAGVAGELYVGGFGVARGYLDAPALTADRFVPDPFSAVAGSRMYRTGDRAVLNEEGTLEFVGRTDRQVKIRGFRVELHEVEAALVSDEAVLEAAAIVLPADPPAASSVASQSQRAFRHPRTDPSLIGFVSPRVAGADLEAVLAALRRRVPAHMVPSALVAVDHLPRTIGGKLDREKLRQMALGRRSPGRRSLGRLPSTESERVVAEVWAEVLDDAPRSVEDDFFALGGDSIRALRVQARLAVRGFAVSTRDIFRTTVLSLLAERIVAIQPSVPGPPRPPFALVSPDAMVPMSEGVEDAFPITRLQAGLIYHTQADPSGTVYREVFCYDVAGALNPAAFRSAVDRARQRHPVLRSSFRLGGTAALQCVWRDVPPCCEIVDVRELATDNVTAASAAVQARRLQSRFDLEAPPLVSFDVVWWREDQFRIVMGFHSAVLDGWSVASLVTEILADHARLAAMPAAPARPPPSASFAEYIAAEQRILADLDARKFWQRQIDGIEPFRVGRDRGLEPRAEVVQVPISAETSSRLIAIAAESGVSLKHVLLAVHLRVLAFVVGRREVVTGVETGTRPEAVDPDVIGLFLNTLPFRLSPGESSWLELACRVRDLEADLTVYRRYPLAEIQRLAGAGDLFDVSFNYTHFHELRQLLDVNEARLVGGEGVERTHFALKVEFNRDPFEDRIQLDLQLDRARIDDGARDALVEAYRRALDAFVTPTAPITEISLQPIDVLDRLQSYGASIVRSVPVQRLEALVLGQARRTPNAVAVRDGQAMATFHDLDLQSNRVAVALGGLGIGREDIVAVLLPRSAYAVVAVLGILRAGATYLPLDVEDPVSRLQVLLRDAKPRVVVTDAERAEICGDRGWTNLDIAVATQGDLVRSVDSPEAHPEDLAYLVYTSGSTGQPKGVAGTHQGMVNRLQWQKEQFPFAGDDVAAYKTSPRFVDSIAEMFAPLMMGVPLVVIPSDIVRDPARLVAKLAAERVTHLVAVPSLFRAMLGVDLPLLSTLRLRLGVSSGEPLATTLAAAIARAVPSMTLFNYYGTSEISADVTWQLASLEGRDDAVAAGIPMPNTRVYVLGQDLRHVPPGTIAEVFVAGAPLARGYVGQPAATAERFVPDPHASVPGARMYRTGDLGCWTAEGRLQLHGRVDRQIKIRGNRVEPGELELLLCGHVGVRSAAVEAESVEGTARLIAYVEAIQDAVTEQGLRAHLERLVPAYAVPASFRIVTSLPRLPSGKIARSELAGIVVEPSTLEDYPQTEGERAVSAIWKSITGRVPRGVNASFFHEGGDSLSAMRFISMLRGTLRAELSLVEFLRAPTVAAVAVAVDERRGGPVAAGGLLALRPMPEARFDAFPLTDVQQAYWIGRRSEIELGGIGSQIYLEASASIDVDRLEGALNALIGRHDMLRAVILEDGLQQTQRDVPHVNIPVTIVDRGGEFDAVVARVRRQMVNRVFEPSEWPLFDVRVTAVAGAPARVHFAIDLLIADAWSLRVLVQELFAIYRGQPLPPPAELTFRDYVLGLTGSAGAALGERARAYWWNRIDRLLPPPELPRRWASGRPGARQFSRISARIEAQEWQHLKQGATRIGVTPTSVLLAVFAEVLGLFARRRRFTLNVTLYNRLPVHPDIDRIVGDFTTLELLELDVAGTEAFAARGHAVQHRLWEDLEHRHSSGVAVLRELARRNPDAPRASMPIVFTSTLGLTSDPESGWLPDELELIESITQTPQVTLDHQVREDKQTLLIDWDFDREVFPDGMVEEMLRLHVAALHRLGSTEDMWGQDLGVWLANCVGLRWSVAQSTQRMQDSLRLEHGLVRHAHNRAGDAALVATDQSISYGELVGVADGVASHLRKHGVARGDRVGVLAWGGWQSIAATVGVLRASAAYVPLDADWPAARRAVVVESAGVTVVVTDAAMADAALPAHVRRVIVGGCSAAAAGPECDAADLAYVIHTSGSTGTPKGVMISHAAAWNTIAEINARGHVGRHDVVLAISSLGFDLSVYDIFGVLAVGGRVVLPSHDARRDPAHWATLIDQHGVTIWNSVPVLMDLLLDYVESKNSAALRTLRLVLLSGDRVPLGMAARIRSVVGLHVQVWALGGATEGAIWSIAQELLEVPATWKSVPYGFSLPNQRVHVWDDELRERGVWAVGELFIAGAGVSMGYLNDPARTAEQFLAHPQTGERVYRTGDLGCHRPDGAIEFLGRRDDQVKIAGHRIELGDVEAALRRCAGVDDVVVVATRLASPRERRLRAFIIPKPSQQLVASALRQELKAHLPDVMVPSEFQFLEAFPLTSTGKVDRRALEASQTSGGPVGSPPGTGVLLADRVATAVMEVLGRKSLAHDADLLALGATSIDAVRIANRLQRDLGFRPELQDIYKHPTIAAIAEVAAASGVSSSPPATRFDAEPAARQGIVCTTAIHTPIGEPIRLDFATAPRSTIRRRSQRTFSCDIVPRERLAALLEPLRRDAAGRFEYASAGGLYAVRVYAYFRAVRVEAIEQGLYAYDAERHTLIPVANISLPGEIHEPFLNRAIFSQAAFSLYFVGAVTDVRTVYGAAARDFCLVEAGAMGQIVTQRAQDVGLGLCPIGYLDFTPIRTALGLGDGFELLHSLVGGGSSDDAAEVSNEETASRLLEQVERLSDAEVNQRLNRYSRSGGETPL